jgi:hypothetical protein
LTINLQRLRQALDFDVQKKCFDELRRATNKTFAEQLRLSPGLLAPMLLGHWDKQPPENIAQSEAYGMLLALSLQLPEGDDSKQDKVRPILDCLLAETAGETRTRLFKEIALTVCVFIFLESSLNNLSLLDKYKNNEFP